MSPEEAGPSDVASYLLGAGFGVLGLLYRGFIKVLSRIWGFRAPVQGIYEGSFKGCYKGTL